MTWLESNKQFGVIYKGLYKNIQRSIHKDAHCSIIHNKKTGKVLLRNTSIFQSLKYFAAYLKKIFIM